MQFKINSSELTRLATCELTALINQLEVELGNHALSPDDRNAIETSLHHLRVEVSRRQIIAAPRVPGF